MIVIEEAEKSPAIIKIIGVGGAGMNTIERMVSLNLQGVEIIAMNTDEQVLNSSSAQVKVHLGSKTTKGMGAGARPEIGEQAALEDTDKIKDVLVGADMVFITAGMGGGTGTGASPVISKIAKELNILTVGVVSLPFKAEGKRKITIAKEGQKVLKESIDTLITIPNDSIFKIIEKKTSINAAFKAIDDILARSVIGISDIINSTGHVNVDFADVRTVMSNNGDAVIGVGESSSDNRIDDALEEAIHHPLLEEHSIEGATAMLINVVGGSDFTMHEYNQVLDVMYKKIADDAHIIIGFREEASYQDKVSMTIIATGFDMVREEIDPTEIKTGTQQVPYQPKIISNQSNQGPLFSLNDKFPNIEPDMKHLNIPTFMRNNKKQK